MPEREREETIRQTNRHTPIENALYHRQWPNTQREMQTDTHHPHPHTTHTPTHKTHRQCYDADDMLQTSTKHRPNIRKAKKEKMRRGYTKETGSHAYPTLSLSHHAGDQRVSHTGRILGVTYNHTTEPVMSVVHMAYVSWRNKKMSLMMAEQGNAPTQRR